MRHNQVIRLLISILGTDKVVNDEEEIKKYSKHALDLSRVIPYNFKPQIPIAVVWPSVDDDIVVLVKFANRGRIPLVPYGGGTGLL